jgi:hypothetical protein
VAALAVTVLGRLIKPACLCPLEFGQFSDLRVREVMCSAHLKPTLRSQNYASNSDPAASATILSNSDPASAAMRLWPRYEAFSLRQGPQVTRAPSEQNSIQSAQYLGRRLFEALFGGKLGTMYELSRLESQGLRVRIVLPHHDRAARLPWELLYEGPSDCRQGDFVALV